MYKGLVLTPRKVEDWLGKSVRTITYVHYIADVWTTGLPIPRQYISFIYNKNFLIAGRERNYNVH